MVDKRSRFVYHGTPIDDEMGDRMRRKVGLALALVGIVFLAAGVALAQQQGVFFKAIMICFECIGIG